MGFEKYQIPEQVMKAPRSTPSVRINPKGLFSFNAGTLKSAGIEKGGKDHVTFFYDKDNDLIGFSFEGKGDKDAKKLTIGKSGASVSFKTFLLDKGIAMESIKKFPLKYSEKDNLWYISLADGVVQQAQVRGPRKA